MLTPAIGVPEIPILLFDLALVLGVLGGCWYLLGRLRSAL